MTSYQSAGTAAACLPAEGTVLISFLPIKVLLSTIYLLLLIRYEYTVSIGLLDELTFYQSAGTAAACLPAEGTVLISVLPLNVFLNT